MLINPEEIASQIHIGVLQLNGDLSPDIDISAPTVIAGHGILASHHYWQELVDTLNPRLQVIGYDLPGHGDSPKPEGAENYTLDQHATILGHMINNLNLDNPPILLGHSISSLIMMRLAARNSDHHAGLVAVNMPMAKDELTARLMFAKHSPMDPLLNTSLGKKVVAALRPGGAGYSVMQSNQAKKAIEKYAERKGFTPEIIAAVAKVSFNGYHFTRMSAIENPNPLSYLEEIETPFRILLGEEDTLTSKILAEEATLKFPGRVTIVRKAGHHIPLIDAHKVVEAIHGVIDDVYELAA